MSLSELHQSLSRLIYDSSAPKQLVSLPEQLVSAMEQLQKCSGAVSMSSGAVMKVFWSSYESAPEQWSLLEHL